MSLEQRTVARGKAGRTPTGGEADRIPRCRPALEEPGSQGGRATANRGPLPERLLARLWRRRSTGAWLDTQDGRRVRVIYPGRPGPGVGPDFIDALLSLEGRVVRGDVEVHREVQGWWRHGHHRDPRYNGVVLHAVGGDTLSQPTTLANGCVVPVVSLTPLKSRNFSTGGQPPTPLGLLGRLRGEGLARALDRAGDRRFLQWSFHYAQRFRKEGAEQALYSGVMEALGYSENRTPFLELAQRLPLSLLRAVALAFPAVERQKALEDLLVGTSGLAKPGRQWQWLQGTTPMLPGEWRLSHIRPGNHPLRRLRGGAALLARYLAGGLLHTLISVVREATPSRLLEALTVPAPLGEGKGGALIGPGQAGDLAVNVVLPALHAFGSLSGEPSLTRLCRNLYATFSPLQENALTREARALVGEEHLGRVTTTARRQQGLILLYREMFTAAPGEEAL